jgi:hypothetical protein
MAVSQSQPNVHTFIHQGSKNLSLEQINGERVMPSMGDKDSDLSMDGATQQHQQEK